jgi:hypothetical protein
VALFPADRVAPGLACEVVQIRLSELSWHRPRQWGACWLALELWGQLDLDGFWSPRLPPSRQGARWLNVLETLVTYRLIDPGSEWHRHWYRHSALGDLLGEDEGVAQSETLYRCLDKLLTHKKPLFSDLRGRWQDLFGARFGVLLYDLTSTYFESAPPEPGYSRDKRLDCVQAAIALGVTPEGFPIAYEVMAGNTADNTTLGDFLDRIEAQYGNAERIWVMDRGIPSEAVSARMRGAEIPARYLVGTPKGRSSKLEKAFLSKPWEQVREQVQVKLLDQGEELDVPALSQGRRNKERAMRRRHPAQGQTVHGASRRRQLPAALQPQRRGSRRPVALYLSPIGFRILRRAPPSARPAPALGARAIAARAPLLPKAWETEK